MTKLLGNLDLASIDELLAMKVEIDIELKNRAADELVAMDKRREQLLLLVGTVQEELVDELKERRTRVKGVAKYQNPANPDQTWTGRGKKPGWMAGADDIEGFRIAA